MDTTPEVYSRPMNDVSDFNAQVDIIIPFHGQYQKVTSLLESIFRLTRSNYYKICIVDDFSPNKEFIETIKKNSDKAAKIKKIENVISTIRTQEQLGFAGACQVGYEATESPYVCFVNSDCKVEDSGWLRSMGETLLDYKHEGVRVVSPMTNNSVGGHESQQGNRFDRNVKPAILKEDEYLTLYCFLCHRQLFNHCGGFLKSYPYGYYEDQEFGARLNSYGFKQAVCRESWISHEGAQTIHELWRRKPDVRDIMEKDNRKRCIDDMKSLS